MADCGHQTREAERCESGARTYGERGLRRRSGEVAGRRRRDHCASKVQKGKSLKRAIASRTCRRWAKTFAGHPIYIYGL